MTSNVMNVRFKIVSQTTLQRQQVRLSTRSRAWDFFIDMSLCEGRSFAIENARDVRVPIFCCQPSLLALCFHFEGTKLIYEELNNSIDKH